MPFLILGRERFALPIGETRVGGTGDDALPFPELARHGTLAVLALTPDGATTLSSVDDTPGRVTVDGVPVGATPLALKHGARIDAAGVRLVFGDLRQHGATAHISGVAGDDLARLLLDVGG